mmetsp:Transcript_73058/g.118509  ORF Transcript_73058/g.118509 Transcript_73058/m.118509 type:complete len:82 (+) Transcript_73058:141-386(+)
MHMSHTTCCFTHTLSVCLRVPARDKVYVSERKGQTDRKREGGREKSLCVCMCVCVCVCVCALVGISNLRNSDQAERRGVSM